jgi:D-glycero-D-manno-heptose 1,7-bisphosphate phosphatase
MQPAVFLDRDGTMIHEVGYLSRREDLRWFSWTIDAIRLLNRAGFAVCVTTNQGGIGLGFYEEQFVLDLHREMSATVAAAGGRIDGWYYCPHYPTAVVERLRVDCDCRKPKPGMIRQAAAELPLDLSRSYVVGDKFADVGLAKAVGAKGVLVKTGHGEAQLQHHNGAVPDVSFVAPTLLEAVNWILIDAGFPKELP